MMPKERDLIKMIWTNFYKSFNIKRKFTGTLVGQDKNGTKYFEIISAANVQRNQRWFEADVKNKRIDGFDENIPAEWEAWLRGRRKVAPTEEEIAKNQAIRDLTIQNAREKGYIVDNKEKEKIKSFPQYDEDYEIMPGTSQDKKKKP